MAIFNTGRGRFFGGGGVLETNIIGDDELARGFVRLSEYVEDFGPPLRAAKAIAKADMHNKFDTDTGPEGKWKALDPETVKRKARSSTLRTHATDILTHTGYMEKMATSEAAYTITPDELIFNTAPLPDYWSVHEGGTGTVTIHHVRNPLTREVNPVEFRSGEGKRGATGHATPPRPWIGLTDEAELQIAEVFEIWYEEGVNLAISGAGTVQERNQGKFGRRLFPAFD